MANGSNMGPMLSDKLLKLKKVSDSWRKPASVARELKISGVGRSFQGGSGEDFSITLSYRVLSIVLRSYDS
jgi:hypothetical protein